MSDSKLRDAERRWAETGLDADADAYAVELERAGLELEVRRVRGRWGIRSGYTVDEILAQLDECARAYAFPMLDNGYVYPGDVRLATFRDLDRWALIIEVVGYSPRGGTIDDCLHVFGNCLGERQPGPANTDFLYLVDDGPSGSHQGEEEELHAKATDLRIRGQVVAVSHDPAHYAERGVTLEEPPRIGLEELMRALVVDHREALLATPEELLARVPADLPKFLSLDEWFHPNLVEEETPSDNETFALLADALVSGRPDAYAPTKPSNTHWSNWPDGGSL